MSNSKVIYLNEDPQKLHNDGNTTNSTEEQFNTSKDEVYLENESLINNSGENLNILNYDSTDISTYALEGGSSDSNAHDNNHDDSSANHTNSHDGEEDDGVDNMDGDNSEIESFPHHDNHEGGGSDSELSTSSMNTVALLELDPMYMRLTNFLQTGGKNKKNLAEILYDISISFDKLNDNLEKLSKNMIKMKLQE